MSSLYCDIVVVLASASDVGSHLYLSLSLDLVIRSSTFASVSGWQLMDV